MSDPREDILDEMFDDYLSAFDAGDFETVASYYTDDVVSRPPTGGEIRGREALTEMYRQTFEQFRPKLSNHRFDYKITGDDLIVFESFDVTMNPPGGEPMTVSGSGMWAARWEDDIWKTYWILGKLDPPDEA
jgi:uncharacterized protein (TIGR02246 family)